ARLHPPRRPRPAGLPAGLAVCPPPAPDPAHGVRLGGARAAPASRAAAPPAPLDGTGLARLSARRTGPPVGRTPAGGPPTRLRSYAGAALAAGADPGRRGGRSVPLEPSPPAAGRLVDAPGAQGGPGPVRGTPPRAGGAAGAGPAVPRLPGLAATARPGQG